MPGTEKKVKSRERGIVVNLQGSHEDTQKNRKEEYQTRCTTEDSVFTLKLCAVPHFLNVMLKTHTHTQTERFKNRCHTILQGTLVA